MNKIIILGVNNRFLNNTNKWLYYVMGFLFLINGIGNLYQDIFSPIGVIFGIGAILTAILAFV